MGYKIWIITVVYLPNYNNIKCTSRLLSQAVLFDFIIFAPMF